MGNIQSSRNEVAKLQRIDLRTTSRIKNMFSRAAELEGVTMSAFLVEAAYEKAKKLLQEQNILKLNDPERDRFLMLIEAPPKTTSKLKAAMKKYLSREK